MSFAAVRDQIEIGMTVSEPVTVASQVARLVQPRLQEAFGLHSDRVSDALSLPDVRCAS